MKKVLLLLGIVLSFALVSCADDPFTPNGQKLAANGNVEVNINSGALAQAIGTGSSQVTQAVISLIDPNGGVQSQTWRVGGSSVFYFNATVNGIYTIRDIETDKSNYVTTNTAQATFASGYNNYISITTGGAIIVTVGGSNTVVSSVSSTASSTSSVASSSSSVASSSSSSVATGNAFGVFNAAASGVIWDTTATMQVWNDSYNSGGCTLANDTTTHVGSTNYSLKIGGVAGKSWFGLSFAVLNSVTLSLGQTNMSAFSAGHLVFSLKSASGITKVGIQYGTASAQVFVTSLSSYGWTSDNAWHTISIPLSAFAGVDFTQIASYLILVSDGANYTGASSWNLDNVYWTKN